MYGITTAAQLAGMSVQALRLYEHKGLLDPARTTGGTRRYSDADIVRLRRIGVLIGDGINLTGIARVLGLQADNADLHADNAGLRSRNVDLHTSNTALRASNTELQATNTAPAHAKKRAVGSPGATDRGLPRGAAQTPALPEVQQPSP